MARVEPKSRAATRNHEGSIEFLPQGPTVPIRACLLRLAHVYFDFSCPHACALNFRGTTAAPLRRCPRRTPLRRHAVRHAVLRRRRAPTRPAGRGGAAEICPGCVRRRCRHGRYSRRPRSSTALVARGRCAIRGSALLQRLPADVQTRTSLEGIPPGKSSVIVLAVAAGRTGGRPGPRET